MNELRETYITIEQYLFPVWEEEFGLLTEKQQEFIRELELVRPGRFIGVNMCWNGIGRPWSSREGLLRAFMICLLLAISLFGVILIKERWGQPL